MGGWAEVAEVLLLNFEYEPTFIKKKNPKNPDKETKFKSPNTSKFNA